MNWPGLTSGYERDEAPWTIGDITLAIALSLGVFGVFFVAVGGLDGSSAPGRWQGNPSPLVWLAAIAESVLLIAVWLIVVRKYRLPWSVVGLRLPARGWTFLLAAAALFGSLAFTAAYAALVSTLGLDALTPEPLPAGLAGDGAAILVSVFALAVWVPFVEEVFFRGFLFAGLAARYGLYIGVTVSAALFALAHFSIATIIPLFVIGILFALVYHATKSIWIPTAAHSAHNLLALLATTMI